MAQLSSNRPEQDTDPDLLALVQSLPATQTVHVPKGRILHWQGDPVDCIHILKRGAIKVSSIAADGRAYTYSVLGPGGLTGAHAYLLGRNHETLAEALEDSELFCLMPADFECLLATDARFSLAILKKLAEDLHLLAGKVRDLGLLDVQQRVKSELIELANEHGIVTGRGIRIDLDLTHREIGEMVAANRTTITACLSELRRQGYLWTEGRHFYIIPPEHMEILDHLDQAVVDGSKEDADHWAHEAVRRDVDLLKALEALTSGMRRVDRLFARGELDVSDVILAAFAMKSAMPIIEDEIARTGKTVAYSGTVVIGTVAGDIHDIGKTMVAMLLKARGFRVIDLGVNVPTAQFVEAVRTYRPEILAMSTVMTVSSHEPSRVLQALTEADLRDQVKIMIGGNAATQKLSERIGADGYEPSAHRAAELAWHLISHERGKG